MFNRKYPGVIKIKGVITVSNKDKSDHVIEVAIESDDFEKYIVANNKISKSLFDLIEKKVKVRGQVTGENMFGDQIIKINDYEVIS